MTSPRFPKLLHIADWVGNTRTPSVPSEYSKWGVGLPSVPEDNSVIMVDHKVIRVDMWGSQGMLSEGFWEGWWWPYSGTYQFNLKVVNCARFRWTTSSTKCGGAVCSSKPDEPKHDDICRDLKEQMFYNTLRLGTEKQASPGVYLLRKSS